MSQKVKSVYVSHSKNEKYDEIVNRVSDNIENDNVCVSNASLNNSTEAFYLDNSFDELNEKIKNSSLVCFFITENLLDSPQFKYEISCAKNFKKKSIYLVLQNRITSGKVDDFLNSDNEGFLIEVYKFRMESVEDTAMELYGILKPVILKINNNRANKISLEDNIKNNVPLKTNQVFIAREWLYHDIDEIISKYKCIVLRGLPGVGKKTYALEYCFKKSKKYILFHSGQRESIIETITKYAKSELQQCEDSEFLNLLESFHKFIKNKASDLILIFSNVENQNEYENILKLINFKMLEIPTILTAKCNEWIDLKSIEITRLKPEECTKYLNSCLPSENKDKIDIVYSYLKHLDIEILPFKLIQIANILRKESIMSVHELLLKINNMNDDTLFYKIFQNLSLKSKDALNFMRFIRFLDPNYINGKILKSIPVKDHFMYIIDMLSNQSLCRVVSYNSPNFGISMHRLVQEKVGDFLEINNLDKNDEKIKTLLIHILNKIFPKISFHRDESWDEAENIYCHLSKFLDNFGFRKPSDDLLELYDKVCNYNIYKQYNCEIYFEYAVKMVQLREILNRKKYVDSVNTGVSNSIYEVGVTYLEQKKYETSVEYFQKALKLKQECLTTNKSDILKILNSLAEANFALKHDNEVISYDLECIKIRKEMNIHDDDSNSFFRLSVSYKKLQDYNRALKYCLKSLKLKEKNDENIQELAQVFSDTASLCKILGYEKKSFAYLIKSYKLRKSIEDTNTSKLAKTAYQIGLFYSNLKQHEKALEHKHEALNAWRSTINSEDICIARVLNSIAVSYSALGKHIYEFILLKLVFSPKLPISKFKAHMTKH